MGAGTGPKFNFSCGSYVTFSIFVYDISFFAGQVSQCSFLLSTAGFSSPVLTKDGDSMVVVSPGRQVEYLFTKDGRSIWIVALVDQSFSNPVLSEVGDDKDHALYVVEQSGTVRQFMVNAPDASTRLHGSLDCSVFGSCGGKVLADIALSPSRNTLYYGDSIGRLHAVTVGSFAIQPPTRAPTGMPSFPLTEAPVSIGPTISPTMSLTPQTTNSTNRTTVPVGVPERPPTAQPSDTPTSKPTGSSSAEPSSKPLEFTATPSVSQQGKVGINDGETPSTDFFSGNIPLIAGIVAAALCVVLAIVALCIILRGRHRDASRGSGLQKGGVKKRNSRSERSHDKSNSSSSKGRRGAASSPGKIASPDCEIPTNPIHKDSTPATLASITESRGANNSHDAEMGEGMGFEMSIPGDSEAGVQNLSNRFESAAVSGPGPSKQRGLEPGGIVTTTDDATEVTVSDFRRAVSPSQVVDTTSKPITSVKPQSLEVASEAMTMASKTKRDNIHEKKGDVRSVPFNEQNTKEIVDEYASLPVLSNASRPIAVGQPKGLVDKIENASRQVPTMDQFIVVDEQDEEDEPGRIHIRPKNQPAKQHESPPTVPVPIAPPPSATSAYEPVVADSAQPQPVVRASSPTLSENFSVDGSLYLDESTVNGSIISKGTRDDASDDGSRLSAMSRMMYAALMKKSKPKRQASAKPDAQQGTNSPGVVTLSSASGANNDAIEFHEPQQMEDAVRLVKVDSHQLDTVQEDIHAEHFYQVNTAAQQASKKQQREPEEDRFRELVAATLTGSNEAESRPMAHKGLSVRPSKAGAFKKATAPIDSKMAAAASETAFEDDDMSKGTKDTAWRGFLNELEEAERTFYQPTSRDASPPRQSYRSQSPPPAPPRS